MSRLLLVIASLFLTYAVIGVALKQNLYSKIEAAKTFEGPNVEFNGVNYKNVKYVEISILHEIYLKYY